MKPVVFLNERIIFYLFGVLRPIFLCQLIGIKFYCSDATISRCVILPFWVCTQRRGHSDERLLGQILTLWIWGQTDTLQAHWVRQYWPNSLGKMTNQREIKRFYVEISGIHSRINSNWLKILPNSEVIMDHVLKEISYNQTKVKFHRTESILNTDSGNIPKHEKPYWMKRGYISYSDLV